MRMHHRLTRPAVLVGVAASLALALPAAAQQPAGHAHQHHTMAMPTSGLRAELIQDLDQLEKKYLGLADAMNGKYGWRPAAGVRSAGEVLMHVAGANFLIPTMAGVQPPEGFAASNMQQAMAKMQELEKITDAARIRETLQHSFMHARHAIAMTPDDQLDAPTKLFGRDTTKRVVLNLLVNHMHEHLGQSIAYARSSGVTPPWSAGGI